MRKRRGGGSLEYSTRATPAGRRADRRAIAPSLTSRGAPVSYPHRVATRVRPRAFASFVSLSVSPKVSPLPRFSSRRFVLLDEVAEEFEGVLRALLDELAEALAQDRDDGLVEVLTHGHALGLGGRGRRGRGRGRRGSRLGRGGLGGGGCLLGGRRGLGLGRGGGGLRGRGVLLRGGGGVLGGSRLLGGGRLLRREGVGMGAKWTGQRGTRRGEFPDIPKRNDERRNGTRASASVDARRTSAGASSAGGVSSSDIVRGCVQGSRGRACPGNALESGAGVARNADTRTAIVNVPLW